MNQMRLAAIVLATAIVLPGCSSHLGWPSFFDPGPEQYQQKRAVKFDPYPQTDMGPPIAGGRPSEFQNPAAEVSRVQTPQQQSAPGVAN